MVEPKVEQMVEARLAALAPRAFGWRAGRQAGQAVRAASEAVRRAADPVAAVALFERLWPATMQVNRAHGDLDEAVERAAASLAPLLGAAVAAEAPPGLLERLWAALEQDAGGVGDPLAERFGAVCQGEARAAAWARRLLPAVRLAWRADPEARCPAALPCLSALAAAGQGPQLRAMFAVGGPKAWRLRRFAAPFVAAEEGLDRAVAFAAESVARSPTERQDRARFVEARLRAAGRTEEAFVGFAVEAHRAHTHRLTFEALRQAWPERSPAAVLEVLVAAHPGEEGKLFATARALGDLARATALIEASPGDPKGVLHAAAEEAEQDPARAERWLFLALGWLAEGQAYKVTRPQIAEACALAVALGARQGDEERVRARLAAVAQAARVPTARHGILRWLEEGSLA